MKYINNSFIKLRRYCEKEVFRGWDPYDGLNSKIFNKTPFKYCSLARLLWIQLFKRSAINLRNFFIVPKGYNPKGLALFLSGYVNLYSLQPSNANRKALDFLVGELLNSRSKGYSGSCWGYNFDWQSRSFFIPQYTPNVIVSTFSGNALIDAYKALGSDELLELAKSTCDFILNDLNRTFDERGNFCFSYTPIDKSAIFNASLLAAKFLSRVYGYTKEDRLINAARKAVAFCVDRQNNDGSWFYGMSNNQKWIDSFHTGYNLESLYEYQKYTGDGQYESNLQRGIQFYLDKFFTKDGIAKYYHDNIYPIDIHSASQLLVLAAKCSLFRQNMELVENVLKWTIENMQDNKSGYFYYQKKRFTTTKIPYMRWSQGWMFYALSSLLKEFKEN